MQKDIPIRRVCFSRRFAALYCFADAPHHPARSALPNDTPKNKQNGAD